jgi:hypothetical protein
MKNLHDFSITSSRNHAKNAAGVASFIPFLSQDHKNAMLDLLFMEFL